ncbi:MAG: hypothetical protein WCK26_02820 [Candidatus Saccharibacteria bacterium]
MNPNDNQQNTPSNYLDQIAPKKSGKADFLKRKPIMIGGIVLAVFFVITIIAAISGGMSGGTANIKRLSARLTTTQNTVTLTTSNLKSTKLRALNSRLGIYLTNTIRDFTPILTANKIDAKKVDKNMIASESNAKMLSILEDARLNAILDRTYAREMAYQLDTVLTLMKQIYSTSSSKSTKTFLDDAYKNLEPIQTEFADFNAANG